MPQLPRRAFIAGLSALPLSMSLGRYARAAALTRTRYNVMSAQGQDMLRTYAAAVRTMMNTPQASPLGWLFQWYTHSVSTDTDKARELARIYPTPGPQRDLAAAVWETCQAHFSGPQQNFLPWHRMYLFYFEAIIRKVSGRADFTLPYWNYSDAAAQSGPRLPAQFRMRGDATFGPLYVEKRNPVAPGWQAGARVNAGEPIDRFSRGALGLSVLNECNFLPVDDGPRGFSESIDGVLHGNVHVLVGNMRNMGDVPWAAYDPIFWLHHCNIDRLWESWNAAGGRNPVADTGWMRTRFTFADENGNRVERAVGEFLNLASLGYAYDRLDTPSRTCPPPAPPSALTTPRRAQKRASVITGAVELRPTAVSVTLEPPPPPPGGFQETLTGRVAALPQTRQLFLVAKGVRADAQPGVLYNLYLDLPRRRRLTTGASNPHYLGSINFFDAAADARRHDGHDGAATKSFSLDITQAARNLHARGRLRAKPTLLIAPAGEPAADAKPVIGEITLVEY